MSKKIVTTHSGRMDSAVLLYMASETVTENDTPGEVHTVTFDYNQRHNRELDCVNLQLTNALEKYKHVTFYNKLLDVKYIKDIAPVSSLTNNDIETPNVNEVMGEAQPRTYVPYRNMMFLSILLSYAEAIGADEVWYGAAQADSLAGYWDGSEDFVRKLNNVTSLNRENKITVHAPLIEMSKEDIIRTGVNLGVNFADTYTCYSGEYPCDAESASSALRLKGFIEAGLKDPLEYKQQEKLNKIYKDKNCIDIITE